MIYTLVLLALSTVIAVFILNLHHRGSLGKRPPAWLRKALFQVIARALCMDHVTRYLHRREVKYFYIKDIFNIDFKGQILVEVFSLYLLEKRQWQVT